MPDNEISINYRSPPRGGWQMRRNHPDYGLAEKTSSAGHATADGRQRDETAILIRPENVISL